MLEDVASLLQRYSRVEFPTGLCNFQPHWKKAESVSERRRFHTELILHSPITYPPLNVSVSETFYLQIFHFGKKKMFPLLPTSSINQIIIVYKFRKLTNQLCCPAVCKQSMGSKGEPNFSSLFIFFFSRSIYLVFSLVSGIPMQYVH